MGNTYLSLNVHLIFATKDRAPAIDKSWRGDLHAYLGGTLKGLDARPIAIGGVEDHVHILAGFRADHCISDLVRETKKAASVWAQQRDHPLKWQGRLWSVFRRQPWASGNHSLYQKPRRAPQDGVFRRRIARVPSGIWGGI